MPPKLLERALRSARPWLALARERLKRIPIAREAIGALRRRGLLPGQRPEDLDARGAPRFVALLAERHGVADVFAESDPLKRLHLGFALTTVRRGHVVRDEIARHVPLAGKRYLDVGCAYGGFLVAFARAGARPTGIEIDPGLLDFARALLADLDLDLPVHRMDVLDRQAVETLGRFEVITCNDVIEHVDDPRLGLERLVGLLDEGGALFMAIPNRHHAPFVACDGHFQHFGITALPKPSADRYFEQLHPGVKHDVTYESLAFYRNALARLGARTILLNETFPDREPELARIAESFADSERRAASFDGPLREEVSGRVLRLVRCFRSQHAVWRRLRRVNPGRADPLADRLILAFGTDFWRLLVRKEPGRVD